MMLYGLKQKIKEHLPDRVIYAWRIAQICPKFVSATIKSHESVSFEPQFISDEETVDLIVNERKSLARFGDGEFYWMLGIDRESFQKSSKELCRALIDTIKSDAADLLIGIPRSMFDSKRCNLCARLDWEITKKTLLPSLVQFFRTDRTYCDASITRPYADYRKNNVDFETRFANIKRIWDKRDVVIVEGTKTKFGMGNDLLDNATSVRRIICPPVNAFEKIGQIKEKVRETVNDDSIILAALGPTATVLAADLCGGGYQVVDIGHVDIEYMWYLNHSFLRDSIEGKYTNESGKKDVSDKYDHDPKYIDSILCEIN